jgi:hypothetical protein
VLAVAREMGVLKGLGQFRRQIGVTAV